MTSFLRVFHFLNEKIYFCYHITECANIAESFLPKKVAPRKIAPTPVFNAKYGFEACLVLFKPTFQEFIGHTVKMKKNFYE